MSWEKDAQWFQTERPSNRWLIKDKQTEIMRMPSLDVADPQFLLLDEIDCLHKLIDFVRYSQDSRFNDPKNSDHLRPAVGLAAPQIGINKNLFYIRFEQPEENDSASQTITEYAMVNAKIIAQSSQIAALEGGEGCLSVDDDRDGIVPRAYMIMVEGYDYLTKTNVHLKLRGYLAIVFQHELDHNQGILYYDHFNSQDPNFVDKDWILL